MNDSLLNIFGDSIQGEVDSTSLPNWNFPFLPPPDSLPFKPLPQIETPITARFLTQTSKEPVQINPQPIIHQSNDWQVGILIFCLFTISVLRLTRKKLFKSLVLSAYSRPMFRQMVREGDLFSPGILTQLMLVVLLTYSVFAFQLISTFTGMTFGGFLAQIRLFIMLFGGILILTGAKMLVIKGLGTLFKTNELTEFYLSNSYYFNIVTTIAILPLLLFSNFDKSSVLIYLAIIITSLLFIYRTLRAILILVEEGTYAPYQKLIYLCTLEILPVFIIFKALN